MTPTAKTTIEVEYYDDLLTVDLTAYIIDVSDESHPKAWAVERLIWDRKEYTYEQNEDIEAHVYKNWDKIEAEIFKPYQDE